MRFLVAYVSVGGLDAVGRQSLDRALRHDDSFGVASLSCSCGYRPLVDLQRQLGNDCPRLSYFMDPHIVGEDEPGDPVLLHSKLVYLAQPSPGRSVTYVGSHNWTSRALGSGGVRNTEISIRYEEPFHESHLRGDPESLSGRFNRHLLDANALSLCILAHDDNRPQFAKWMENACSHQRGERLAKYVVILAIGADTAVTDDLLQSLATKGIYTQVIDETDGELLCVAQENVLVLLWRDAQSLRNAEQPTILTCRASTKNATSRSARRGSNASDSPVAGFRAILRRPRGDETGIAETQAGDPVEFYRFELLSDEGDSRRVDGGDEPLYRYLLETEYIVFPRDSPSISRGSSDRMQWPLDSLAFAEHARSAPLKQSPGYRVAREREVAIKHSLAHFGVVDSKALNAIMPFSEIDEALVGKRLSRHISHDLYLRHNDERRWKQIAEDSEKGALIPARFQPIKTGFIQEVQGTFLGLPGGKVIAAMQRAYSTSKDKLLRRWGGRQ